MEEVEARGAERLTVCQSAPTSAGDSRARAHAQFIQHVPSHFPVLES